MLDKFLPAGLNKEVVTQIIFILAVIVVFYFFSIRPQRKKYKEQKDFLSTLKIGSKIVTVGGIYGEIIGIDGNRVTIVVSKKGSTIDIDKSAISVEATLKVS